MAVSESDVDPRKFPRLAGYLRNLPEGLDSYPDCIAKASLYRRLIEEHDFTPIVDQLPSKLLPLLEHPEPINTWIPAVQNNAFLLAMTDHFYNEDLRAAVSWYRDVRERMFKSPLYRMMMAVISPRYILRGASKRWETFHRGTVFEVEYGDHHANVVLTYPHSLQTRLIIRMLTGGLLAALAAAGAKDIKWGITSVTPTEARLGATWK